MASTTALTRMKRTVCGSISDPASGDSRGGIDPGVAFTDLPEDRASPTFRAGKSRFIEI